MGNPRRVLSVAAAAVALVAAACGGPQGSETTEQDESAPTEVPAESTTTTTTTTPADEDEAAVVARSDSEVDIHPEPDAEPSHALPPATSFGSPRALLVVDEQDDWLEVSLPERPNGSTGWVRRDAVELQTVDQAIEIDLETRTLTLFEGGEEAAATTVAIGTSENPTPTGDFYVVDKLDTGDPDGAYGPFAFGLSAYSETLSEFAGGDGQVGIHGTNDPSTIGEDVSHGCVRVPNEVADMLNETLYLGTPVTIK